QSNWGLISLLGELSDKSLWGYVLKLPVDTELARVRGVVGYNLPKWLIPIGYNPEGDNVEFTYYDEQGKLDFSMTGRKLDVEGSDPEITRLNFVNLDANGQLTHGYSDVRAVKRASSRDAIDIRLGLSDGPLSTYIRSLGLERLVRYDYQPEFQAALYTPEVIQ
ncbi:MAG: acetoacetate decarboxylase (ADC), partial [Tritonibacter mobilis]|nr:acetoacetate decarboxylase (ADC) [Tritonibacter mobilis]